MNTGEPKYFVLKSKLLDWFATQEPTAFLSMRWARGRDRAGSLGDTIEISCDTSSGTKQLATVKLSLPLGSILKVTYFI